MINTRKNAGRVIAGLLSTPGWMPPASAQAPPIIVDRTAAGAQPVLETRDGVPVIQIAPPSAGGISHNRYLAFNVGPAGAILNNGGDGNATQLIGPIAGNPYLEAGPAATILNEVTAPNPSELRGMLEVAGQPAHVIVANPAGITCDGCGWLNSSRATLTTGRPGIGPEGRLTLEVTSGALSIQGAGLDGRQVKQIDLLARVLTLNAGVWADQLHVGTGPARVDADSGEIDPIPGQGSRPEVAIDAAALGGMYANSIRLVGSEAGVGVNLGGHLHALTGDLTLTAAGEVHIAPHAFLTAKGLLAIHTATRLDSHGRSSPGEQARNRDEGRMQAHTVSLTAQDALRLTAARIEAETVSLSSGGNIDLFSEDESRAMSSVRHPFPYRASHLYAANLSVQAGNDFQTRGMHMVIDRDASLHAARDIQFHDSILLPTDSAAERYDASSLSPHGAAQLTRESLPGHAALSDGTLQEARTATGQRPAALRLTAGRDVVIQSGSFHESASSYGRERDESLLWVRVKTTRRSQAGTSVRPAVLNGQDVEIVADQDIQVRGAEIRAQGDLILSARRDVTISAGVNERESHHVEHIRETGLGTMGRWSLGRSTRTRVWEQADRTFTASVIDSVTGTTTIQGGNAVTLQASRVLAPEGDIALGAKRIELHDMSGRRQTRISAANAHGGIAFAVGTPALAAWQVMNQVNDAQKSTPSRLTQALLVSASGLAIDHARAVISEQHKVAGGSVADFLGNIRPSLQVGVGTQTSASHVASTHAAGSYLEAGGDLTVQAAGPRSDISVEGATLCARGDLSVVSQGGIEMRAARDLTDHKYSGDDLAGWIGIGASLSAMGPAWGLHLSGNYGARQRGESVTQVIAARASAEGTLSVTAANDVTLQGAQLRAVQAQVDVGDNLLIESFRDTRHIEGDAQRYGASGVIGVSLTGTVNWADNKVYANVGNVNTTGGIHAGDGGFDIYVNGRTTLRGARITSTAQAELADRNCFHTHTLMATDVENSSRHEATGRTLGGSKFTVLGGGVVPSAGWSEHRDEVTTVHRSAITGFDQSLLDAESSHSTVAMAALPDHATFPRNASEQVEVEPVLQRWDMDELAARVDAEASIISTWTRQAGQTMRVYTRDQPGALGGRQTLWGEPIDKPVSYPAFKGPSAPATLRGDEDGPRAGAL